MNIPRLVNISSETVPGFFFPERVAAAPGGDMSGIPLYFPVDEAHPIHPQDPYALSKSFGEQLCDAAVTRSPSIKIISIRPSWCQDGLNIERNIGPLARSKEAPNAGLLAYIIIHDLARAIALAALNTTLPSHEVFYIAAPDAAGGHDLVEWVKAHYGEKIPLKGTLARPDASSLSCAKAEKLLGWTPRLTWRDFLDSSGHILPSIKTIERGL
jgi:UDP-glucose 4-epimerase